MVPSLSQIAAYCASNPCRCPLYQRYEASQKEVCPEVAMALFAFAEEASAMRSLEPSAQAVLLRLS